MISLRNSRFEEFVERVRAESDIVSLVSEYVPLKKKGKNFWGCCPFHHEKTPSFSVSADKGFFYCFGCQAGGDAFQFLMKIDNLGFMDAAAKLADKLCIPLPEKEQTPQEAARERETRELYRINEMARDFYHNCLTKTGYGEEARRYLADRGLSADATAAFRLGFAPPGWDKLTAAFREKGIREELLVKAGLSSPRPAGDGYYDRFRNRIMFPISDARGRVVGFGGRVIDDSQPKYLNSPETALFNKRHILFALAQAAQAISDTGQAIVVEGYMDAITAHMAGVRHVVASLGTAFTPEQARLLAKQAREIVFAYDSDAAGQNATLRALETVRKLGITVRVASVPDGKDPDDFIRRHGGDAFRKLLSQAPGLLDYQIRQAMLAADHTRLEGKVAVVAAVLPSLIQLDNAVEIDGYIVRLAQMLGIDERAVRSEYQKHKKDKNVRLGNNGYNTAHLGVNRPLQTKNSAAEASLLRLMLEDSALIPYVTVQLTAADFQDEARAAIMSALVTAYEEGRPLAAADLAPGLEDRVATELSRIMVMDEPVGEVVRLVDDYIKTIRLLSLRQLYETHRLRADELERLGDKRFQQELAESKRINDEIKLLLQS